MTVKLIAAAVAGCAEPHTVVIQKMDAITLDPNVGVTDLICQSVFLGAKTCCKCVSVLRCATCTVPQLQSTLRGRTRGLVSCSNLKTRLRLRLRDWKVDAYTSFDTTVDAFASDCARKKVPDSGAGT